MSILASTTVIANAMPSVWFADDPDAAATSPEAVYEAALRYVDSGLSVIPIDISGDKAPDCQRVPAWKIYQLRLPRPDELRRWYEHGGLFGLAAVGGLVSGRERGCGLEIIDFDNADLGVQWIDAIGVRAPGLIDRLPMVITPRPGLHVYFRSKGCQGCGKLACAPVTDSAGNVVRDVGGQLKKVTLVERKGEGGYTLVPPSPKRCHPRNRLYQLLDDSPDLTQIPVISVEEREILLTEARQFNRWQEREVFKKPTQNAVRSDGNRPGDDFNRRASWPELLGKHGWVLVGRRGDIEDWQRPGKDGNGLSATINYGDSQLLYVFSSNAAPFDDGRAYDKFAAFALLEHGGDFCKAAQALQDLGYGRQTLPMGKRSGVYTTVLTRAQ